MFREVFIAVIEAVAAAVILGAAGLIWRRATLRRQSARQNCSRILEWFHYIDTKLDSIEYNPAEVEAFEKEISYQFNSKPLRKYALIFNTKFIGRFLKSMGIQESLRNNLGLFRRYARLDFTNTELALSLTSSANHIKYSIRKIPFSFYWISIWGNYTHFFGQYKSDWKSVKEGDRKYTLADVEVPIQLLRMYFGI